MELLLKKKCQHPTDICTIPSVSLNSWLMPGELQGIRSDPCFHPFRNKTTYSLDTSTLLGLETKDTHSGLDPPLPWHHLPFLKLFDLSDSLQCWQQLPHDYWLETHSVPGTEGEKGYCSTGHSLKARILSVAILTSRSPPSAWMLTEMGSSLPHKAALSTIWNIVFNSKFFHIWTWKCFSPAASMSAFAVQVRRGITVINIALWPLGITNTPPLFSSLQTLTFFKVRW